MKICRDDLRYTDDVIATLQSDNPRWYIAKALNIPIEDVEYHYEEVRGIKHSGSVLVIEEEYNHKGFPLNPKWYETRTRREIAEILNKTIHTVNQHVWRFKITCKRGSKCKTVWPTNPEWYRARTTSMIAEELHVTFRAVRDHMAKHGYKPRRVRERFVWPKDAAWYASRTIKEISKELGILESTVRGHIITYQLKVRPSDAVRRMNWPKDASWYASRTIKEMSAELNISVSTVRTYVHRWKIAYRLVRTKRETKI